MIVTIFRNKQNKLPSPRGEPPQPQQQAVILSLDEDPQQQGTRDAQSQTHIESLDIARQALYPLADYLNW